MKETKDRIKLISNTSGSFIATMNITHEITHCTTLNDYANISSFNSVLGTGSYRKSESEALEERVNNRKICVFIQKQEASILYWIIENLMRRIKNDKRNIKSNERVIISI